MISLEVLAIIFSVAVLIKAALFFIDPEGTMKISEVITSWPNSMNAVLLLGILFVGYVVISTLGIIAVASVMLFAHLLMGLLFIQYPKESLKWVQVLLKDKKRLWVLFSIWAALAIWVLFVVMS